MLASKEQIKQRIKLLLQSGDIHNTVTDLMIYLPYDDAKDFVRNNVSEDDWAYRITKFLTRENVVNDIINYMPYAWHTANEMQGSRIARSIQHIQNWLYLLGEFNAVTDIEYFSCCGKPQLRAVCEKFGINWKLYDNGIWRDDDMDDGISADEYNPIDIMWNNED